MSFILHLFTMRVWPAACYTVDRVYVERRCYYDITLSLPDPSWTTGAHACGSGAVPGELWCSSQWWSKYSNACYSTGYTPANSGSSSDCYETDSCNAYTDSSYGNGSTYKKAHSDSGSYKKAHSYGCAYTEANGDAKCASNSIANPDTYASASDCAYSFGCNRYCCCATARCRPRNDPVFEEWQSLGC